MQTNVKNFTSNKASAFEELRLPEQPRAPSSEGFSKRIKTFAELRAFAEDNEKQHGLKKESFRRHA